ncbi:MAG: DUF983 domain-containing protein [Planctomycetes bacterium]|nr:DUF983 domain-containing protein [Planctomycetota bacterium]
MPRTPFGTIVSRALKLRCPRCGAGPLFRGMFRMYDRCSSCGLKYERAPGYFLGSAYINYGVTAVLLTVAYVVLHFGFELTNRQLMAPLMTLVVVFPLAFFRWARSWWLAMDCYIDREGFESDQPEET